jgi:hypothetical protein
VVRLEIGSLEIHQSQGKHHEDRNPLVEIDTRSVLTNPDFHDAVLTGVIMKLGVLELQMHDLDQKSWSLIVPETLAVSATNLLKRNIIFEIEIFHKRELHFNASEFFDLSYFGTNLQNVADAVLQGKLTAIRVGTSFGVDLVAVSTATVAQIKLVST